MEQQIKANGVCVTSTKTPWGELAWNLADSPTILKYLKDNGTIILGGDIITPDFEYTYANWFYNIDSDLGRLKNVYQSYDVAAAYLKEYTESFGIGFYVVFVVK